MSTASASTPQHRSPQNSRGFDTWCPHNNRFCVSSCVIVAGNGCPHKQPMDPPRGDQIETILPPGDERDRHKSSID